MKNLATCKPTEFVAQTAKIRKAVANWIEIIDLMKIRNTLPAYRFVSKEASAEEKTEVIRYNAELKRKQAIDNFNTILDNALEKHPQETLEILALCCFVEPDHVDDYTMDEYLQCIMDIIQNKSVLSFFSLLAQLDQTSTLTASKA